MVYVMLYYLNFLKDLPKLESYTLVDAPILNPYH
jgi:hypothetical protein